MNCYRVVILDENDKVLISKIVIDGDTKENVTMRLNMVIALHEAPFTVSVTDYASDTMNVFDFMSYLSTALKEMSLRGGD